MPLERFPTSNCRLSIFVRQPNGESLRHEDTEAIFNCRVTSAEVPQRLKPSSLSSRGGTAEAVPFPKNEHIRFPISNLRLPIVILAGCEHYELLSRQLAVETRKFSVS